MLTYHIALVSQTSRLTWSELARTSAALQKQVLRDFGPIWGVVGSVDAFPALEDVPGSYWPLFIRELHDDAEAGVFLDEHGRPWAQVADLGSWSLAASRACLELLVNPLGARRVETAHPHDPERRCSFLMEICAPCRDALQAYVVDGVQVSDFATPAFFEPGAVDPRARYSFRDTLEAPLTPLPGGFLHWQSLVDHSWWARHRRGAALCDEPVGARVETGAHAEAQSPEVREEAHAADAEVAEPGDVVELFAEEEAAERTAPVDADVVQTEPATLPPALPKRASPALADTLAPIAVLGALERSEEPRSRMLWMAAAALVGVGLLAWSVQPQPAGAPRFTPQAAIAPPRTVEALADAPAADEPGAVVSDCAADLQLCRHVDPSATEKVAEPARGARVAAQDPSRKPVVRTRRRPAASAGAAPRSEAVASAVSVPGAPTVRLQAGSLEDLIESRE